MKNIKKQNQGPRLIPLILVFVFLVGLSFPVYTQITLLPPDPNIALKWDIYEITLIGNDDIYANPFWDVEISGMFTGPNSEVINKEGFYYDIDTWKLRFAPIEEGIWEFIIYFKTANDTVIFEENFECLPANNNNHGFITVSDINPYNFAYSDNTPLIINGINGHTPAVTASFFGIPNTPPPADSLETAIMWEYIASKNVNSYRLQMFHQNWAPPVFDWNTHEGCANLLQNTSSLDRYDIENAKLIDKWFRKAAEFGINIYPCLFTIHEDGSIFFFNQSPWSIENGGFYINCSDMYSSVTEPGHSYVKKYVQYVVNRYGAFHNILGWEYNNEWGKYTSPEWINSIDTVITNSDPYNRAHVISYWGFDYSFDSELHDLPSNEIVDFHIYPWGGYDQFNIDSLINKQVSFFYDKYEKPINIGEFGSGDTDIDIPPEWHYFDRIGYWATFISGGSALYWLRGDWLPSGVEYNIETIEWINSFGNIVSNIQNFHSFVPQNNLVSVSDISNLRAYCLGANNEFILYFHHFSNHTDLISNKTVQITVPDASWEASWFDPNTGYLISKDTIECVNGELNLNIPAFSIDLVLYLYTSSNIIGFDRPHDKNNAVIHITPNPFSSIITIEFNLPNRSFITLIVYDINGKVIKTLITNYRDAGQNSLTWNGTNEYGGNISPGLYLLKFESDGFIHTKKIIYQK